jgi:hypothetical protein
MPAILDFAPVQEHIFSEFGTPKDQINVSLMNTPHWDKISESVSSFIYDEHNGCRRECVAYFRVVKTDPDQPQFEDFHVEIYKWGPLYWVYDSCMFDTHYEKNYKDAENTWSFLLDVVFDNIPDAEFDEWHSENP